MLGRDRGIKEGQHAFFAVPNGESCDFVFGAVTSAGQGGRIGISGVRVNPVGLKNKVAQSKAGQRSSDILTRPTPDNCIFALIYRIEYDNYVGMVDEADAVPIPPRTNAILEGWVRESLPELLNAVLSLPPGDERDAARKTLRKKMDSLLDRNLRHNLYSVCRSLKILT